MTFFSKILEKLYSNFKLLNLKRHGKYCVIKKGAVLIGKENFHFGHSVYVGRFSRIEAIQEYNGKKYYPELVVGDNVSIQWFTHIACANRIIIGRDCLIAGNVFITDHNHGFSSSLTWKIPPAKLDLETNEVTIGERCWIGEGVIILPGVTIGEDSIIGAGSVVTKSVPKNSIAVGNPARVVKKRTEGGDWRSITAL